MESLDIHPRNFTFETLEVNRKFKISVCVSGKIISIILDLQDIRWLKNAISSYAYDGDSRFRQMRSSDTAFTLERNADRGGSFLKLKAAQRNSHSSIKIPDGPGRRNPKAFVQKLNNILSVDQPEKLVSFQCPCCGSSLSVDDQNRLVILQLPEWGFYGRPSHQLAAAEHRSRALEPPNFEIQKEGQNGLLQVIQAMSTPTKGNTFSGLRTSSVLRRQFQIF